MRGYGNGCAVARKTPLTDSPLSRERGMVLAT
jgi:hypothetical protein